MENNNKEKDRKEKKRDSLEIIIQWEMKLSIYPKSYSNWSLPEFIDSKIIDTNYIF